MSKSDFDAFVQRQQVEQQQQGAFDPAQQLSDWLKYLEALYKQITTYLRTYVENGTTRVDYNEIQLNEDFIGPYTAQEMVLKIGRSTVKFSPIGTMLIGMKGRVDVEGPAGTARLYLLNKKATSARSLVRVTVSVNGRPPPAVEQSNEPIEWVWKIGSPPPEMKFNELTQESFFEMVLEVANA